jgi:hypothetical protein
MNIEKVKIEDVKSNSENPRIIKDDKYRKLVIDLLKICVKGIR